MRLASTFARCREDGRPALVAYVMGGDPTPKKSLAMARACIEGGADILELGIPFSDPIADGPTIQRAAERALKAGTTVNDVLNLARELRKKSDVPIALMGYLNPVLSRGVGPFLDACAKAGVDALILPDLPPEEADLIVPAARARGVSVVFLLAPTSTPARWDAAFAAASGFIYFVSVAGVTGARKALPATLGATLESVRAKCPVPVVVGFGVSTPAMARELGAHADGVVVGSAIVSKTAEGANAVRDFVASLKRGLRPRSR